MAFTVEDGTGVVGANSYSEVAAANTYFTDRGVTGWSGTDDAKKGWLVQATDFIEKRFRSRFIGTGKLFPDTPQGLSWPRAGLEGTEFEDTLLPTELLQAVYEYALRAKSGPLAPDPGFDSVTGLQARRKRTKVGPIETELDFGAGSTTLFRPYPAADMLLRPLLRAGGGVIR